MSKDYRYNQKILGVKNGIWVEKTAVSFADTQIASGPRIIGVHTEDASLAYRFWIKDNPYVSKSPKTNSARINPDAHVK